MFDKKTKTQTLTHSQKTNSYLKFALEQLDFSEVKSVTITTAGEGMDTEITTVIKYKKIPRDLQGL